MKEKKFTHGRILSLAEMAVLTAIIFLMAFTSIGYIHIGALSISLITIPVAVGAIVVSPAAGAFLGFVFGCTSFFQCFGLDPFGTALFSISPFFTFLLCVPTRTLAGFLCGLLFRLFHKKMKVPSYYIGSFLMAFFNTLFFMLTLVLCFWDAPAVQQWSTALHAFNPLIFMIASVGINAIVEWAGTTVVGGTIEIALNKIR